MDRFRVLHDYRILVRRELAPPILCGRDSYEYVVELDENDEPKLHCFLCGSDYHPGEREYQTWLKAVEEKL